MIGAAHTRVLSRAASSLISTGTSRRSCRLLRSTTAIPTPASRISWTRLRELAGFDAHRRDLAIGLIEGDAEAEKKKEAARRHAGRHVSAPLNGSPVSKPQLDLDALLSAKQWGDKSKRMANKPLDLDALMGAKRWGDKTTTRAKSEKPVSANPLDTLMSKKRYGGAAKPKEAQPVAQLVNYSPEYPHDIDVGPLFCTRANRCFLDGGGRCGEYQTGKRNKGMLEDLYRACQDTGFFFIHNTFLTSKDYETPLNHMAAIYATESDKPGALGITADPDESSLAGAPGTGGLGFTRLGIDHEKPGMVAKHMCFSVGKEVPGSAMTNKWPPESFRPDLKRDTVAFFNQMDAIADKLSLALCDMIGLPKDSLARSRTDKSISTLHHLQFPASENVLSDAQGLAIVKDTGWRTDPGIFLIISQTEPCFQVQNIRGDTCNLRCGTERLIVLLGDVVEVVTNGHLKATKYRVVPRKGERAAIEFAARLDPEVQVKPHPMFIEESGKVMPSVTQLELMSIVVPGLSCYSK